MYLCSLCGGEFSFLIFEYNTVVCEKCSIRKGITNCSDFDASGTAGEETAIEEAEDDAELIDREDTQQLLDTLERIQNPRIRAYFKIVAQQYFGEGLV